MDHPNPIAQTASSSPRPADAVNDIGRRLVNINQACTLVGVSRRTMYNWIQADKVDYVRTAGGTIRIFADSLYRRQGPKGPLVS